MSTAIARNFQIGIDPTPSNNFTLYQPATPDGTLRLGNGNTGITSSLLTLSSAGQLSFVAGSAAAPTLSPAGDSNTGIFFPAADTIAFAEGGVEAMRLDAAGNLGLGVTPQTQSTGKALEVGRAGNGIASWFNNNNIVANMYYDSVDKFAGTGFALQYYQDASNGIHVWRRSSASGSAGGTASMSEFMRLDASGNLLVGGTSNAANARLLSENASGNQLGLRYTGIATWYNSIDSSGNYIWTRDGTERARITSSGDFLVGRTSSSGKFCVSADTFSTVGNRVALFASTYSGGDSSYEALGLVKYANDNGGNQIFQRFFINQGNNGNGQIVGAGSGQATFASYSDARLKENIVDLPPQLANIMALRPVEFDYKDGSGHQINFIAQEMREVYPDCVSEDNTPEKMLSIAGWSKTEARLVKAIQEQQATIEQLKARLDAANL